MLNIRHLYGRLVPRTLTWSFCVKAEAKLVGLLLRVVPLVFGHLTSSLVKVSWGYARNVRRLYLAMGPRGLAIYLKACYVLTQHAAGGMVDASPWALGANVSRTRRGIPRIINPQHRSLIVKGDVACTRFWLTLFGLYRVVEFKGALKLRTITDPGIDISEFRKDWLLWIPTFYSYAREVTGHGWKVRPFKDLSPGFIPFIRKSSPNSGGFAAVMSLPWDIALLGATPTYHKAVKGWLAAVDGLELTWVLKPLVTAFAARGKPLWDAKRLAWEDRDWGALKMESLREGHIKLPQRLVPAAQPREWLFRNLEVGSEAAYVSLWIAKYWGKPLWFGRLGFKEEPGKLRVFAMVTPLLQTLMHPLHKWIFDRLRAIPTDGTFNQTAPVERLIERFRGEDFWVASFDLSAATDRLPVQLQQDLLVPLLGEKLASYWRFLLTAMPYGLPKIAKSYNLGFDRVWYAVGQPMGALSSWAMLALTHHALVQMAAKRAYPERSGWFLLYAVLGDDVVIADRSVAREYLRIMRSIGVEISLAKSLVSCTGSLEFAKRTWVRGRDASPISLAEMLVALTNLGSLAELVRKNMKFGVIRLSSVARFCGFGYRNLARLPVVLDVGNRLTGLIAFLCRPGGEFPMPFEAWISSVAPGGTDGRSVDTQRWAVAQRLWTRMVESLRARMAKVSRLMASASTVRLEDITFVKNEKSKGPKTAAVRRKSKPEVRNFWSSSTREFLLFETLGPQWETFFREWVGRPYAERIRPRFIEVDDVLRTYDAKVQPTWSDLEHVWKQVLETESGVNSLPTKLEWANREDEDLVPSTRLITLWRALRKIATRDVIPSINLSASCRDAPQARRGRSNA